MAIAYDAQSKSKLPTTSTLSWSHTCTGSDLVLIVSLAIRDNTTQATGITYNGVAMTYDNRQASGVSAVELWYLVAPATGANTIAVTMSTTVSALLGFGVSYTGVHQSTPIGTSAGNNASDNAPTVDVTSASGEVVVDVVGQKQASAGAEALTVGASQTSRGEDSESDGASFIQGGVSEEAGATTTTMSWSSGESNNWSSRGVPLKPAAAAGTSSTMTMLGVG